MANKYNNENHISVVNFQNNELVSFSLVILRGTIEATSSCCQAVKEISVRVQNGLGHKEFVIEPKNDKFKCIVELQLGANYLFFQKCCVSKNLTLQFYLRNTIYTVLPLYIICQDDQDNGKFQSPVKEKCTPESACNRIDTATKMMQSVIAEKLYEWGLGRKTFHLEDCQIFYSKLKADEARKMSQQDLWTHMAREIMRSSIGSSTKKFVAFLSATRYKGAEFDDKFRFTHENVIKLTEGYVALGGGGLALFGTGCLYTWPESINDIMARFEDETLVDRKNYMDDSCYRGTLGACFATTLGSTLHELCHTFDLGHADQGIMARGFDNIHKVFLQYSDSQKTYFLKPKRRIDSNLRTIEYIVPSNSESSTINSGSTNSTSTSNFSRSSMSSSTRSNSSTSTRSSFSPNNGSEDDTFFTESNAVLLYYHRWFNDYIPCNRDFAIKFDAMSSVVKCTAGLRLIELRNRSNELVLYEWLFTGRVLKYSFQIPQETLKKLKPKSVILVVEDNFGNIMKEEIYIT